jgi:hypothetical protein
VQSGCTESGAHHVYHMLDARVWLSQTPCATVSGAYYVVLLHDKVWSAMS